jgi:DNA-directed RNA polymerase subunit RPC12/RpoP
MPYDCIRCGAQGSVRELHLESMALKDFANIDLDLLLETKSHIYNVIYDMPPWWCESCKSIFLRTRLGKFRKDTDRKCRLCGEGTLKEFENVEIGDVVIKDSLDKIGDFTVDEAVVCDHCDYMTVIETGTEVD